MPVYAFGPFVLASAERRLTRSGRRVALPGKAWQILLMLAEAGGRLVEHETFRAKLWPDVVVEDRTLAVHVSTLRKALAAAPAEGYVETVARVGYRLTVPVRLLPDAELPPPQAAPAGQPAEIQPLAVRTFATHGLAEADTYLGAGMTDAVTTLLGRIGGLTVRPTGAIDALAGTHDSIEAGRALGIGYVLEGTVRREAERLHVSARLVDMASARTTWSERFEQPLADSAALPDAIARRVVDSLALASTGDPTGPHSYRPQSSDAYFLQLQARTSLNLYARLPALKAMGLFEQALALDPNYAAAHAGLASTYLFLTSTAILRPLPVDEAVRLARESAQRALALDDSLGEAWAVLGRLKMEYEWDWDGAEADLAHAVALNASSVETIAAYGQFLSVMGRHNEALEAMEQARRLDPRRLETLEHLAVVCWMADQPDRAFAALADALKVAPTASRALLGRMIILDQLGRHGEAMADRLAWLGRRPDTKSLAERLVELDRSDWRAAMQAWLALLERGNHWNVAAMQWMAVGEPARALDILERCVAQRTTYLAFLLRYPSFRPLHGEPRFAQMVRTLRLDGRGR